MKKRSLLLLTVSSLLSSELSAVNLKDFISHLSNASNFNTAGSYQDQSAGHYTAGGLMVRQRSKSISPINVRLPSMGGSCGDFDVRFGGISFIKGQEFSQMLKATASGVPSYALQLALKTVSPQIEGTMNHIRTMLQKINGTMLNDCWARQQLLEGILPSGTALHEQVCQDMAQSGFKDDYTGARDRCAKKEDRDEAVEAAKEKHKDLLAGEYNLVWNVLKKMERYQKDNELSELILSMVGTVVSVKDEGGYKVTFLDPKIDNKNFLEAHLRGGKTTALVCGDKKKCLDVASAKKEIDPEASLKTHVSDTINLIKEAYLTEGEFKKGEKAFLSDAVNLPVYKYIQVSAASKMETGIERAAEYIALVILLKQFEDAAAEISEAISYLESVQPDTHISSKFKERLESARSRLHETIHAVDNREMWMIEKIIKAKEQELMANFELEKGI